MRTPLRVAAFAALHAAALTQAKICWPDQCFTAVSLNPVIAAIATEFCELYIHSVPVATTTIKHTVSTTATVTPAALTSTDVVSSIVTVSVPTPCSTTVTVAAPAFSTFIEYAADTPKVKMARRAASSSSVSIPSALVSACTANATPLTARLSSACSCFLTPKHTTTVTTTLATTLTAPTPPTVVTSTTTTSPTTVSYCSSTQTITVTSALPIVYTCGVPVSTYTSGTVTCPNNVPSPSANVLLRIEGDDTEGTIFEGCIASGPCMPDPPSGGSHSCDGTNNGANSSPGDTPVCALNAASQQNGFPYDGTYDSVFSDYSITTIGSSSQTATEFWGLLVNFVFTPVSGCEFEVSNGDLPLWAYNAFNVDSFLQVTPGYTVVQPGASVLVQVKALGGSGLPLAGASIAGVTTDANGYANITASLTPGCYQFKATASNALRSNAFYLSVVEGFGPS